jgi:hypothetical protein
MFANPQSFAINVSVSALSASDSPQSQLKLQEEYVLTAGASSDSHRTMACVFSSHLRQLIGVITRPVSKKYIPVWWMRAASKQDGLLSVHASLNGGPPLALSSEGELPPLLGRTQHGLKQDSLRLPPESYGFVTFQGTRLSACVA